MWVRARAASSKGTVSSVPAWFRADSGTNLIKQGEIVTGRPCGSVAQWSKCSIRSFDSAGTVRATSASSWADDQRLEDSPAGYAIF